MKTTRSDAVKGYKLDFATNTLTINYKFNKALSDFGSKEYKRYKAIMRDFPNLTVVVKAGREITTTRPTKRLTYDNMETYIGSFENADALLDRFAVVQRRSKAVASPYKFVRDWFQAQFPEYKDSGIFVENKPAVPLAPVPDTALYTPKDEAGAGVKKAS